MPISEPFARALAAGRPQFNERVASARHRFPAFDTAVFRAFLETRVDAIATAVHETAPERLSVVVAVVYDVALDLVGQALAGPGAREPWVDRAWSEVAPRLAKQLAQEPLKVVAALSNAALRIGKTSGARGDEWIEQMAHLGPRTGSFEELRSLGQVLAWRCGLPHYRMGALEAGDRLPEALALGAVSAGEGSSWGTVRENLQTNPWWFPGRERNAPIGHAVGAFTGFGGIFGAPPEIRAMPDGFVCRSEDRLAYLVADVFGAVLMPATQAEFEDAAESTATDRTMLDGSTLALPYGKIDLDLPPEGLRVTSNAHTVAVTSPYSFRVRVLPLR